MEELFPIKFNNEEIRISTRDLHKALEIKERYSSWFKRIEKYFGQEEFTSVGKPTAVNNGAEIILNDYETSVDNAKHICLMSKTEKGKECRRYLIDLEKAWNTPEQVMARALRLADRTIESLKNQNKMLIEDNERMKPKEIFADAVSTSKQSILIGDLAKLICQNGHSIGQKRLFQWMRDNGYLMKQRSSYNMPKQKYVEQGIFEIKESTINNPDGSVRLTRTTKITGKGQIFFINKFLKKGNENAAVQ